MKSSLQADSMLFLSSIHEGPIEFNATTGVVEVREAGVSYLDESPNVAVVLGSELEVNDASGISKSEVDRGRLLSVLEGRMVEARRNM